MNEREQKLEQMVLKEHLALTASRCAEELIDALKNCVRNEVDLIENGAVLRAAHTVAANVYLSACYASQYLAAEKKLVEAMGGTATPSSSESV